MIKNFPHTVPVRKQKGITSVLLSSFANKENKIERLTFDSNSRNAKLNANNEFYIGKVFFLIFLTLFFSFKKKKNLHKFMCFSFIKSLALIIYKFFVNICYLYYILNEVIIPIGCDWLHEISISIRATREVPNVSNERLQRLAMLESNTLLKNLLEMAENPGNSLIQNLAIDILNWILTIRLARYRCPKSVSTNLTYFIKLPRCNFSILFLFFTNFDLTSLYYKFDYISLQSLLHNF